MKITQNQAQKVIDTVSAGLSVGVGKPKEGKMCIEAAVCFALGLPHGDRPACVHPILRDLKITINDWEGWSSNKKRADALLKLSVLQLGTDTNFNEQEFAKKLTERVVKKIISTALLKAAEIHPVEKHKKALEKAALECEAEGTSEAAKAANKVANAASKAAYLANMNKIGEAEKVANKAAHLAYWAAKASKLAYKAVEETDITYANWATRMAGKEAMVIFVKELENILVEMKVDGVRWLKLIKKEEQCTKKKMG